MQQLLLQVCPRCMLRLLGHRRDEDWVNIPRAKDLTKYLAVKAGKPGCAIPGTVSNWWACKPLPFLWWDACMMHAAAYLHVYICPLHASKQPLGSRAAELLPAWHP